MKIKALVATKQTQGQRKNDFCFVPEGEPVFWACECDVGSVDDDCGCHRSLCGVETLKTTTTFKVVECEQAVVIEEGLAMLANGGWLVLYSDALDEEGRSETWLRDLTEPIEAGVVDMAEQLALVPGGTVVERREQGLVPRLPVATKQLVNGR